MSHTIPVEELSRLAKFNEHERAVMQYALLSLADGILADAEAEEIDREALPSAAGTFAMATAMAYEIADMAGEERPPLEAAEMLALCIAEGDAPLAAKMAAEAEAGE